VPSAAKAELERIAGGRIVDAPIAWGGYGPSATFILHTADGRKFFCKGTHPDFTTMGKAAFETELAYYSSIPELAEFGPAFLGVAHCEDWHLMVLDHVELTIEVPPWTPETFHGAVKMLARFHARTPARACELLPIAEEQTDSGGRRRTIPIPRAIRRFGGRWPMARCSPHEFDRPGSTSLAHRRAALLGSS
jgi:hypothetical protein